MANNIIKVSDLANKQSIPISQSASDPREKFTNAMEVAKKEIENLDHIFEQFCKNIDERYAICELVNLGDALKSWYEEIMESTIKSLVNGNPDELSCYDPNYKKIRYDFFKDLIKTIEKRENNKL